MSDVLITVLILLVVGVGVLGAMILAAINAARRESSQSAAAVSALQQQIEAVRQKQDNLGQSLEKSLRSGQENISQFLTASQQTFGELKEQIGKIKGNSEHLLQIGADIRTLQNLLNAPKLRGQIGEFSLASLLQKILPADSFTLQHAFSNGKIVDALVRLPDFSVPIDAKFPLPAFEKMIAAPDEAEKTKLRRQFQADVVKHIDKIAASYILPDEGTLDFALMYIPAENVYYETIIKYDNDRLDLLHYALDRKVVPVSPNLLYAYLMTIVMGLHGMQIEKQAAAIRANLQRLAADFEAFGQTWDILGQHLRNAQNQYDRGQSRLNRFQLQLEQIQQTGNAETKLPGDAE
ncbi:MAG TPA: DNA recombination protein RmuC [Anaerohalosphaeraceae bacterium]|nr:DNA recombination protein RmuC [Anaerohalosphaeraceae bacterium]HOM76901.1 DNA recombination protein RmuC [Anaerohalosphaeraceae bacterium]HPC64749.1 DNA recombination protein RmuC [Anaerohalosphaeraceae bacterium]HPO70880.1 DNA recombination protein RmuC [Anaerohalosphaeraceae bacterium]HRS72570.1 DNA recombination protein RmuC [Anaerohalosphaeraceae bacterium]